MKLFVPSYPTPHNDLKIKSDEESGVQKFIMRPEGDVSPQSILKFYLKVQNTKVTNNYSFALKYFEAISSLEPKDDITIYEKRLSQLNKVNCNSINTHFWNMYFCYLIKQNDNLNHANDWLIQAENFRINRKPVLFTGLFEAKEYGGNLFTVEYALNVLKSLVITGYFLKTYGDDHEETIRLFLVENYLVALSNAIDFIEVNKAFKEPKYLKMFEDVLRAHYDSDRIKLDFACALLTNHLLDENKKNVENMPVHHYQVERCVNLLKGLMKNVNEIVRIFERRYELEKNQEEKDSLWYCLKSYTMVLTNAIKRIYDKSDNPTINNSQLLHFINTQLKGTIIVQRHRNPRYDEYLNRVQKKYRTDINLFTNRELQDMEERMADLNDSFEYRLEDDIFYSKEDLKSMGIEVASYTETIEPREFKKSLRI